MKIEKIQSSILTPRVTGFSAASALGITILSGISKNNYVKKVHKPFSMITVLLTLLHIGLIEYSYYKYNKNRISVR